MNETQRKTTIWHITIFVLGVMTLAFIGPLLGGSPSSPGLGFILWGSAPLVVALLLRFATRDWTDAGLKPAIAKNIAGYLISILAWPFMILLTLFGGTLLGVTSISGFSLVDYLKTVLPALVFFFVFAIFEEFGWRGYLVPKLASLGIRSYLLYIIVGVVWATWHLPYIRELLWVYNAESLTTFIPRFYLACIAFSVLFSELRLITGSIWPAVIIHCLANSIGHPLTADYLTIAPGKQYLGGFDGLFMITFAILLGIALYHWRTRKMGLASMSPSAA